MSADIQVKVKGDVAGLTEALHESLLKLQQKKAEAKKSGHNIGQGLSEGIAEGLKVGEAASSLKGSLLGAFGLSGGILAFGEFIKGMGEEASQIRNIARTLGESTDSIQHLQKAAKIAGVDIESITKSFLKLEGALGDKENSKAAQAFADLGISGEKLASAKIEDKVLMLAQAFEQARRTGSGYHDMQELIGKSAASLVPLLAQGSERLEEFLNKGVLKEEDLLRLEQMDEKLQSIMGKLKRFGKETVIGGGDFFSATGNLLKAYFDNITTGEDFSVAFDRYRGQGKADDDAIKKKLEEEHQRNAEIKDAQANAQHDAELQKEVATIEKLRLELAQAMAKADFDALTPRQQYLQLAERELALRQKIQSAPLAGTGAADVLKMQIEQQKLKDQMLGVGKTVDREHNSAARAALRSTLRGEEAGLKSLEDYQKTLETDLRKSHAPGYDDLRKIGGSLSGVNYNNPQSDKIAEQTRTLNAVKAEITTMREAVIQLRDKDESMQLSGA
jgi:hypothetical protein